MASRLGSIRIAPDISGAFSLPARSYSDLPVLQAEKDRIFSRTWQVAGHCHQLANPRDFFTIEMFGEPLLLVCRNHGELRGFYNVCRHRAGPPADGCGSRKLFRCGYHGWTYGLDGKLIGATEFDNVQEFDRVDFALTQARAEQWFNLILVNFDPEAEPLQQSLGSLPQQAERFDVKQEKGVHAFHLMYAEALNPE
jgi:choline monooxygenase